MTDAPDARAMGSHTANLAKRRQRERIAKGVLTGAAGLTVLILAFLLARLAYSGLPALNLDVLTNRYSPNGLRDLPGFAPAGLADALYASLLLLVLTMLIAVPLGVGGAIYLNEYAREGRFKRMIESWISNLAGVPSVVYGLLGLAVWIRFFQMDPHLLAGALTMAVLILPIIIVASQEALKSVPATLREASFGLGATRWQTVRHHVLPNAIPGILTGNILALSRAAGETAPLIVIGIPTYTTLAGAGPTDLGTPLQIRLHSLASYAEASALELAAATVIVLVVVTLGLNLAAIFVRHRLAKKTNW